ncbi:Remorin family protein isoform 1 [Gossypium australe]|uniref:Remorin family protein isoform 1 n=1 Tax=Gossypium australe TaxID=47621 RepID=A0A5B6X3I9_9ROSI|nr:Remorin family protein isoform 1 [Gossypium australe]
MAELGLQDRNTVRSGYRAGAASPDSVIFTLESNFSLFSSASASVDRCSFASDAHDRDSIASELSLRKTEGKQKLKLKCQCLLQHMAGQESGDQNESSSGPDPDPDPNKAITVPKHIRLSRKGEKVKVKTEESGPAHTEDETQLRDSARNSFSLALKECQDRKTRSDALLKNPDRRRPASLDLNNISGLSPRLGTVKKSSVVTRKLGAFPSPGTPNYHHHSSVGMQKGWSSERVPLHSNGGRRQGNASGLLAFNNGRTLPSKWEDAERWIFSPVSGDAGSKQSIVHPQRRPKSKSGPLGPPGIAYYSLYSPALQMFDGGHMGNFMAGSPFSAGVIAADGLTVHSRSHDGGFAVQTEPCMGRSVSVHGCSEAANPPSSQDAEENLDVVKDAATDISQTVSRRDMATQMSPQSSTYSSPKGRPSFSPSSPSALPIMELQSIHGSKSVLRDVPVDERVTLTRWSKKHRARNTGKSSEIVDDWRKKVVDTCTSTWDVTETGKSISKSCLRNCIQLITLNKQMVVYLDERYQKLINMRGHWKKLKILYNKHGGYSISIRFLFCRMKREEAKITAWENLQKAKAEAAIRKLEMKLEKKRSSSMDKIMNKLRSAQKRAQDMRSSMLANQAHQKNPPDEFIEWLLHLPSFLMHLLIYLLLVESGLKCRFEEQRPLETMNIAQEANCYADTKMVSP